VEVVRAFLLGEETSSFYFWVFGDMRGVMEKRSRGGGRGFMAKIAAPQHMTDLVLQAFMRFIDRCLVSFVIWLDVLVTLKTSALRHSVLVGCF
jgi:hypothetical protein